MDDELKRLARSVRATFGDEAFEDAITRALTVALRRVQTESLDASFDANAVCYEALKLELRRMLQRH